MTLITTFRPTDELVNHIKRIKLNYLIIEFVPKNDSQVEKLLKTRDDIFDWYDEDNFEKCFSKYFEIVKKNNIQDSMRVIYLMRSVNKDGK